MTDIISNIHELASKIGEGTIDQRHVGKLNAIVEDVIKSILREMMSEKPSKEAVRMTRLAILSKVDGKLLTSANKLSHGNLEAMLARWSNESDYTPNQVARQEIPTLFQSVRLHEFERELMISMGQAEMELK